MKRVKPSNFEVLLNYKLWLSNITGDGIIGDDTFRLMKKIHTTGSLSASAKELGISYRKAWGDIREAEELIGYPLTVGTRGGMQGGTTVLTDKARKLLEAYDALHVKLDDMVEEAYKEFREKMKNNG